MLALRPETAILDRAESGVRRTLTELWPDLRRVGVAGVSPNGVLGDPTGATAEQGRSLLDAWVDDLARALQAWC